MGLRFRKSIKVGKNTRINLSKSGLGVSSGVKGARVSVNQKGTRKTLSIPGTGISHVSYSSHGPTRKSSNNSRQHYDESADNGDKNALYSYVEKVPTYGFYHVVLFVALFIMLLLLTIAVPFSAVFAIGVAILSFKIIKRYKSPENKANKKYNKAIKSLRSGSKDKAFQLFSDGLELDPSNSHIHNAMAITSFFDGDYRRTINHALLAKGHMSVNDDLMDHILAYSYFWIEDYENVISILEPRIDDDNLYKMLSALSYRELGKVKKASEILSSGPVNKRTYTDEVLDFKYWLGVCYLELGDKQKAIRQLEKVYEVDSDFLDIVDYAKDLGFAVGEHLD